MGLDPLDVVIFLVFVVAVISFGVLKSRHEKDSEGYFLAGRGLTWWLIGFSLIAANISTEQFVGMSGQAANYVGLAIASYEWMAAITLVVCAFFFLPKFLRAGIYTIPEFLEYRFDKAARSMMAAFTMIVYVGVTIAAVIYSGALMMNTLFPDLTSCIAECGVLILFLYSFFQLKSRTLVFLWQVQVTCLPAQAVFSRSHVSPRAPILDGPHYTPNVRLMQCRRGHLQNVP